MKFPALPKIQNGTQRTAAKLIAGFFALMLVFTVVSRAAEGMTTATVQAETPKNGVITDRVTLSGAIKPMEDMDITLVGNLYVTSAKAEAGQRVEEGDVLLEFDADDLRDQLETQQNSLSIARNKLAIAENGAITDTTTALASAALNLEQAEADQARLKEKLGVSGKRAQEDLNAAKSELDKALKNYDTAVAKAKEDLVDAAQSKADSAQKAVDSAQKSLENTKESAVESVASAQYSYDTTLLKQGVTDLEIQRAYDQLRSAQAKGERSIDEAESALSDAQKALSEANSELRAAKYTRDVTDKQGVVSAQNSVDSARRSVQSAQRSLEDNARSADEQLLSSSRAVAKAQRDLEQAQRDAADKERTGENSALQTLNETITLEADIAAQEKTVALLEEILEMDGKLLSPIDGTVQSIANTGKTQDKASVAKLSRGDAGFYFSARTTPANAASLAAGDTGNLTYKSDGRDQRTQAEITDIGAADDDGSVPVRASLPEGSYPSGASGELAIARTGERQSTCVPVSALRSDSDGDYVLILEEKRTVTGLTYTARRVDVEIAARDSALASLQGGLDREALVITSASKPVAEGDRVRLEN